MRFEVDYDDCDLMVDFFLIFCGQRNVDFNMVIVNMPAGLRELGFYINVGELVTGR